MRLALFSLALAVAAPAAQAQDYRGGFWAGGDVGVSSIKRDFDTTNDRSDTKGTVALRGGYAITPRLLLGLEASGWTFEREDKKDDARGQGLSTLYLFGQVYPL